MLQQWFDQSVGNSRYNALQVTVQEHATHGVTFLAAYTLSHSNADGCNLGASCDSQNPYNSRSDYGTSDLNEKNVFYGGIYGASPYNKSPNKLLANVAGGWALNGIVQETSGQPYQVNAGGDPLNVGCCLHRKDERLGQPEQRSLHTRQEWFNTGAFTAPTGYTYGNEKVNSLVSQHFNDVDMSLFRDFHYRARRGAILRIPSRIVQPLQ